MLIVHDIFSKKKQFKNFYHTNESSCMFNHEKLKFRYANFFVRIHDCDSTHPSERDLRLVALQ
jgi:hypothetical protein